MEPYPDQLPLARREEASSLAPRELICGVERKLVEDFLKLIQDNYKKADAATAFLENRAGVSNVHAFTNVRDALSHLATMLDPQTPPDKKRDQLVSAEEHLRRAILEPYELALGKLTQQFKLVYENYNKYVVPSIDRYVALNSAPNTVIVGARLREINELAIRGRKAKGRNLWTPEWESGVASFIEAYDRLITLKNELEGYYYKYERIDRDEGQAKRIETLEKQIEAEATRSNWLQIGGYVIGILGIVISIILVLFPSSVDWLRTFLRLS